MNARKAKQLRKLIRGAVASREAGGNEVPKATYVEQESRRKTALVPTGLGKESVLQVVAPGTIRADTTSVRGIYLALKKGIRGASK